MNIPSTRLACVILSVVLWGCGSSMPALNRHLEKGHFDKAVAAAADDPHAQKQLAALLLEQEIRAGRRTSELLDALRASGRIGRESLGRLSALQDATGRQAKIAGYRTSHPGHATLARFLGDDSADVRARAAQAWGARLPRDLALKLLLDDDPRVRRSAVRRLVDKRADDTLSAELAEVLRLDPDPKVRAAAAKGGRSLGPGAVDRLKAALEDSNLGVQLSALQGLADTDAPEAFALLEELAVGPLRPLSIAAAAELARADIAPGRERLLAALEDPRGSIRKTALLRLERAQFEDRVEIFTRMLHDEDEGMMLQAAYGLLRVEDSHETLRTALRRIEGLAGKRATEARNLAAVLGDPASIAEVTTHLESADELELLAILAHVGRCAALKNALVKLIAHRENSVRVAAALAVLTPPL